MILRSDDNWHHPLLAYRKYSFVLGGSRKRYVAYTG